MPGFRHPRNPARSPRRPAHIGESPRRSRRPGPRSNPGGDSPTAPARSACPACAAPPGDSRLHARLRASAGELPGSRGARPRQRPRRRSIRARPRRLRIPRPAARNAPPRAGATQPRPGLSGAAAPAQHSRGREGGGAARHRALRGAATPGRRAPPRPRRRGLAQAAGAAGGGWRARAAGGALAHVGDAAPGKAGVQPGRICAAIDGPAMRPRPHGGLHGEALRGRAAAAAPVTRRCAGLDATGGANHRVLNAAGGANCRS